MGREKDIKGKRRPHRVGAYQITGKMIIPLQIRAKITKSQEIAQPIKDEPEEKFEDKFPSSFNEFKPLFDEKKSHRLPEARPYDHSIELKPDWKPIDAKVYSLPPVEDQALKTWLNDNQEIGYISPSKSPISSSFFYVQKKDSKELRPIIDYRRLNEMTVKNKYPLPRINDLLGKIGKSKYFSTLDVRWGYMNILIKPKDRWKAAFKTKYGLFEPNVMLFGLTNSPATFQAFMDDIYRELVLTGKLLIYMDDIFIHSETEEEH